MAITLTPTKMLLLQMLIASQIDILLNKVADMTEEEVKEEITREQERKSDLLNRL